MRLSRGLRDTETSKRELRPTRYVSRLEYIYKGVSLEVTPPYLHHFPLSVPAEKRSNAETDDGTLFGVFGRAPTARSAIAGVPHVTQFTL